MHVDDITAESCGKLTERRKGDRAKMAAMLEAACIAEGATVVVTREGTDDIYPKRVRLLITGARGMFIGIDFDGQSCQPDIHVGCWNLPIDATDCFNPKAFICGVNTYHYQKATVVAEGLYPLILEITANLRDGFRGRAFSAEIEAEYKRKTDAGLHPWQQILQYQQEHPNSGGLLG